MDSQEPGCPRCPLGVTAVPGPVGGSPGWRCDEHGDVPPLWRPAEATYGGFVAHLQAAGGHPTWLPWPLGPAWTVSDHGRVGGGAEQDAVATLTCSSGASALDGPVDVLVVSEEPGVGLGARCSGLDEHAPSRELGEGRPVVRVLLEHQTVPLWQLSTAGATAELDRSVLVGEASGRWLWMVLRPASAILLLREDWILRDAAALGPTLVEMSFGGARPPW